MPGTLAYALHDQLDILPSLQQRLDMLEQQLNILLDLEQRLNVLETNVKVGQAQTANALIRIRNYFQVISPAGRLYVKCGHGQVLFTIY